VANTKNFFKKNDHYKVAKSDFITQIYNWSKTKKILLLAIPYGLINLYFLTPFFYFIPAYYDALLLLFKANVWTNYIGILLVISGRLITFGSMLYLRRENNQTQNSFKLHTNGIFKLTRNPGLDGMFLFFVGFGIIFPSLFIWIGLLFYVLYMQFRVKIEEEFLKQLFGQIYYQYMKNTKRFLLF
jgi:protein-S-isoprenylcysteine O-methyltransferase Ste14